MQLVFVCLLYLLSTASQTAGPRRYGNPKTRFCINECQKKAGKRLSLTDYINSGRLDKVKSDFAVKDLPGNVWKIGSYAGFMQTDSTKSMFWWYFPPMNKNASAPLLIWLQGGPGGASTFGLFSEIGPFSLEKDYTTLSLVLKEYTWGQHYHLLFIDNPVGAGFSHTTDEANGYCKNTKECVADNLFNATVQFYTAFPELVKNELYITGESYGGHYVPAFGAKILKMKEAGLYDLPLAGIAVGDGWVDPVNQLTAYPNLLWNIGLCNKKQKTVLQDYVDRSKNYILEGDYKEAFEVWDQMLNGDIYPYPNYFHNITGLSDYDNFLNTEAPASFEYYSEYLSRADVRRAINVGSATLQNGRACEMNLVSDFMVSFNNELGLLLNASYKVLIYSGQLDIIIGPVLTEQYLDFIPWSGITRWKKKDRDIWKVDDSDIQVAGYSQSYANFNYVIVRDGGHILPYDQPRASRDMIERFVDGKPFTN